MKKFFLILIILNFLNGDYVIQKTWKDGPGIFYTQNLTGFFKGKNIDYFKENGFKLLENNFFMFYPKGIFGNYGTINKIFALNSDTVFISVSIPDTTKIFYTFFYKGFASNQYFKIDGSLRDMIKFLNRLWIGTYDKIYYTLISNFPPQPILHTSWVNDFKNFVLFQNNLYFIQGSGRCVRKYNSGTNSFDIVYTFNYNEVHELIHVFSDSVRIFILAKKDSIWKIYKSYNGYSYSRINSPPDSFGYVFKGISRGNDIFVLIKSPPKIFKYSFSDSIWEKVLTGDEYTSFEDIEKGKDGIIYVLARRAIEPKNILFSSYDGKEFYICDILDNSLEGLNPKCISYIKNGHFYIGTENEPQILYSVFPKNAFLISSVISFKKGNSYPVYEKFKMFKNGGDVKFKVRTFSDSLSPDTISWNSIPYADSIILNYSGINQGEKYFEYMLEIYPYSQINPFNFDSLKIFYHYDSVGPYLIKAIASDGEDEMNGKDPDDRVIIVFDEPTEKPEINKFNVDSIFPLSNNHSWLNIYGDFGGAEWNEYGDTLTIFLSYSGNNYPTVSVGDTLKAKIKDRFGFYNESYCLIEGSFDDVRGPKIKKSIASDGEIKENGIDQDDYLIVVFNENTNMPDFDTVDINLVLKLSSGHTFGDSVNAEWINPCSLIINLIPSANPLIYKGDTIYPSGIYLKDSLGNPAYGFAIIEGTFDEKIPKCDSIILYENDYKNMNLDYDDFVVFYFSEDLKMNREITNLNIDHAFKLSKNHTWVSGNGKIGEIIFNKNILIVFFNFEISPPSISPYDTVYINSIYFSDYGGNELCDTNIIIYRSGIPPLNEFNLISEKFFINFPFKKDIIFYQDLKDVEIKVYDVAGRCLNSLKLKCVKKGEKFEFKNLKKGIYFLEIKIKDRKEICKKILL
ncbi:MAG: T9SS type A sorting domain-containing protein [candidate division WOR-3 bacterium]